MRPAPILAVLLLASAEAHSGPSCTPPLEGVVACLDGKLCECRRHSGGSIAGRPAGVRWDCGTLRPSCGAPAPPSLDGGQTQQPLPFLPLPAPPAGWR